MDGPAWKRQRMDEGPGGPSRQDSVFYKTRMCHKCAFLPCWQEALGPLCIIMAWQEGLREQALRWHKGNLRTWSRGRRMHISASFHLEHLAGCSDWRSKHTGCSLAIADAKESDSAAYEAGLLQMMRGKATAKCGPSTAGGRKEGAPSASAVTTRMAKQTCGLCPQRAMRS